MPSFPEGDYISIILNGGYVQIRDTVLRDLCQDTDLVTTISRYVMAHEGNGADAQDVFQDAIVLFDRNIQRGKFKGDSALRTYFIAIAKWHWVALRRQKGRNTLDLEHHLIDIGVESPETAYITTERKALLEYAVSQMGEKCKQLLTLYKLSYSMEEIANIAGLSSADMAKKDVYKCRLKLKEYLLKSKDFFGIH